MIGCSHDVTERRKLQEAVVNAASAEQRRIGQELHDTTGQELVGLGYLGESLVETLGRTRRPTPRWRRRSPAGSNACWARFAPSRGDSCRWTSTPRG
jgi:hypothetical protein